MTTWVKPIRLTELVLRYKPPRRAQLRNRETAAFEHTRLCIALSSLERNAVLSNSLEKEFYLLYKFTQ